MTVVVPVVATAAVVAAAAAVVAATAVLQTMFGNFSAYLMSQMSQFRLDYMHLCIFYK